MQHKTLEATVTERALPLELLYQRPALVTKRRLSCSAVTKRLSLQTSRQLLTLATVKMRLVDLRTLSQQPEEARKLRSCLKASRQDRNKGTSLHTSVASVGCLSRNSFGGRKAVSRPVYG